MFDEDKSATIMRERLQPFSTQLEEKYWCILEQTPMLEQTQQVYGFDQHEAEDAQNEYKDFHIQRLRGELNFLKHLKQDLLNYYKTIRDFSSNSSRYDLNLNKRYLLRHLFEKNVVLKVIAQKISKIA